MSLSGGPDKDTKTGQIGNRTNYPVSDFDLEEFQNITDVNLKGVLLCMKHTIRVMKKQEEKIGKDFLGAPRQLGRGSIVNISSASGLIGMPNQTPYVAAKHAVQGITKVAGQFLS